MSYSSKLTVEINRSVVEKIGRNRAEAFDPGAVRIWMYWD